MSDSMVKHLYQRTSKLIEVQQTMKKQCIQKLNYNLKKIIELMPPQLLSMKVSEIFNKYDGNIDIATQRILNGNKLNNYQSPPKYSRKKIIKKRQ